MHIYNNRLSINVIVIPHTYIRMHQRSGCCLSCGTLHRDRVRLLHCLRFVYISVEEGNEEMQSEPQSVKRTAPAAIPLYCPRLRMQEWKRVRDTFVCCCLSYYLCTVNRYPTGDRQQQTEIVIGR